MKIFFVDKMNCIGGVRKSATNSTEILKIGISKIEFDWNDFKSIFKKLPVMKTSALVIFKHFKN